MKAPAWLPFLHELADCADAIALRYFRSSDLEISAKSDATPVTAADLEIEQTLRERTLARYPDLGFMGEEFGETAANPGQRLILDPIDATANFARGIPIFATLIALENAGEIVAGVVSAPALSERWHAARGAGAFRGHESIRVSARSELDPAQVFHGALGGVEATSRPPGLRRLAERARRDRGFGDFYQHVLVAQGSGELALDPEQLKPWDIAPLQVLVEEAGGRATSVNGERSIYAGSLISSNGHLHDAALAAIAG